MEDENKSLVDNAIRAAERLENATKEFNKVVDRQEAIAARMAIGGRSDAGQAPPEKKEETPAEYKDRIMRGGFSNERK